MDSGHKRKNFKGNLKRSILPSADMTVRQVLDKMPDLGSFVPQDLEVLVRGWFTDDAKVKILKHCAARSKHKFSHTSGSKSYPRVVHEMKRNTGVTPTRTIIFQKTHTKSDGNLVTIEVGEKMDTMRTAMSFTPTSSEVSTLRSIQWSNDDPYAQALERFEYSGRVYGVGSGVLPTRSTPRSSTTPATQDPALSKEVNVLIAKLAALKEKHQAILAA